MTKRMMLPPLMALVVVGMLSLVVWADDGKEEEVTMDQVPAAVKATILKEAAGAKIIEIEREMKNDKAFYEAEFLDNGQKIEIKVAEDGTLLGRKIEREGDDDDLTIEQVPEPARSALRALVGDGRVTEVEKEQEQGVVVYEAEWVANGTKHEAAVLADGTLLETEEIISVAKAPSGVRAAILKQFPGAQVVVAKKMIVVYEIEAKIKGKEVEVLMFPTGQIVDKLDDDDHGSADDDDDDDD